MSKFKIKPVRTLLAMPLAVIALIVAPGTAHAATSVARHEWSPTQFIQASGSWTFTSDRAFRNGTMKVIDRYCDGVGPYGYYQVHQEDGNYWGVARFDDTGCGGQGKSWSGLEWTATHKIYQVRIVVCRDSTGDHVRNDDDQPCAYGNWQNNPYH